MTDAASKHEDGDGDEGERGGKRIEPRPIFQSGTAVIVLTGRRGDMPYGRLVDLDRKVVGYEQPIASILAKMPYEDFQPWKGDGDYPPFSGESRAVMELLAAEVEQEGEAEPPI